MSNTQTIGLSPPSSLRGAFPYEMLQTQLHSIGDNQGKVTISDCHLGGRIQRQAYTGPVYALAVALDGLPAGSGTTKPQRTLPHNYAAVPTGRQKSGVVVTLGDDSVIPAPSLSSFQAGATHGNSGAAGSTGIGAGGGTVRSPYVLKFWGGVDMVICVRTVDVAAQMVDPAQPPQQRWAPDSAGLSRLTAFAVTSDAMQVKSFSARKTDTCTCNWGGGLLTLVGDINLVYAADALLFFLSYF